MQELSETEFIEALYIGIDPKKLYAPDIRENYNRAARQLGIDQLPEKPTFTEDWFMPEEYKTLDLVDYFSKKVSAENEQTRIAEELSLFIETNNESLLRYLIYLGEIIKENNIVTGIGRGSSTSLFLLYLCGIHKVNSLKFDLSPYEFFKIRHEKEYK